MIGIHRRKAGVTGMGDSDMLGNQYEPGDNQSSKSPTWDRPVVNTWEWWTKLRHARTLKGDWVTLPETALLCAVAVGTSSPADCMSSLIATLQYLTITYFLYLLTSAQMVRENNLSISRPFSSHRQPGRISFGLCFMAHCREVEDLSGCVTGCPWLLYQWWSPGTYLHAGRH